MSRKPTLASVPVIIVIGALLARAQTMSVTGRVIADETNEPLPNARVSVMSGALGIPVVLTDGEGRFALTVANDRSAVVASKTGYARSEVTPAAGRPIDIRLRRAAAISGRVVDEIGDPVPNARIFAEAVPRSASNAPAGGMTTTDDRGEYRLSGLPAGTFAVAIVRITLAASMGQDRRGSPTVYYPGAATLETAQALRVGVGEDRDGIDFVVEAERPFLPPVVAMRQQQIAADSSRAATAAGTAVIRGQVSSTDGRAVPHAHVMLLSEDPLQSRVGVADERGLYEFRGLAAGTFQIGAAKTGYVPVIGGELSGFSLPIPTPQRSVDLTDGATRDGIDLGLARLGTMTGRVFDDLGDPLGGAVVQLLQIRYEAGRRRLVATGAAARPTDDLGRYRLFAVTPGNYVVSASVGAVQSTDIPGYARSYFPGTSTPGDAQFVSIATSQDVVGIDFTLSRTRTARIAGTVLDAAGHPVNPGALTLLPGARSSSVVSVGVGARILSDGRFEFSNVPSGQYIIRADRGKSRSWAEGEFGTLPVAIDGSDVTNLVLPTGAGSTIKGRFSLETYNNTKAPAPAAFALVPVPVDSELAPSSPATADIHSDWTFDLAGITGLRRLQLMRAPAGWTLKEIRVTGIDVTDRPLAFGRRDQSLANVEVVVTDRLAVASGTVIDRDRPSARTPVIVFAADRDRWYSASRFLRIATTGSDGTFTIAGMPASSYYVAAVKRLPAEGDDAWQDPEYLRSLIPGAASVNLRDGQQATLNLQLPSR